MNVRYELIWILYSNLLSAKAIFVFMNNADSYLYRSSYEIITFINMFIIKLITLTILKFE